MKKIELYKDDKLVREWKYVLSYKEEREFITFRFIDIYGHGEPFLEENDYFYVINEGCLRIFNGNYKIIVKEVI